MIQKEPKKQRTSLTIDSILTHNKVRNNRKAGSGIREHSSREYKDYKITKSSEAKFISTRTDDLLKFAKLPLCALTLAALYKQLGKIS